MTRWWSHSIQIPDQLRITFAHAWHLKPSRIRFMPENCRVHVMRMSAFRLRWSSGSSAASERRRTESPQVVYLFSALGLMPHSAHSLAIRDAAPLPVFFRSSGCSVRSAVEARKVGVGVCRCAEASLGPASQSECSAGMWRFSVRRRGR